MYYVCLLEECLLLTLSCCAAAERVLADIHYTFVDGCVRPLGVRGQCAVVAVDLPGSIK